MSTYKFYMPNISLMGPESLQASIVEIQSAGYAKALIVTDYELVKIGLVNKLTDLLQTAGIDYCIFDQTQPNPTVSNVEHGLDALQAGNCDFVISFGGGSPHDCAKAIALVATNGGSIKDYEGVDQSSKAQLPLVAVNTTAGTASEMTRFTIITDETRHIKMAIVDKNTTPVIAVNDPLLMLDMPQSLTAATGMDALTHAIEAYVSTIATPITDACALKAISLIAGHLRKAVDEGHDEVSRDAMAYAEYLAGMAFNSASLGYVHAMAHQLGGFYDLPHGVCNAVLLPHVQQFNKAVVSHRLGDVARAMGENTDGLNDDAAADRAIAAIKRLARDVNIPSGLHQLGVQETDFAVLATNALNDACGLTNPQTASHQDIVEIFANAY